LSCLQLSPSSYTCAHNVWTGAMNCCVRKNLKRFVLRRLGSGVFAGDFTAEARVWGTANGGFVASESRPLTGYPLTKSFGDGVGRKRNCAVGCMRQRAPTALEKLAESGVSTRSRDTMPYIPGIFLTGPRKSWKDGVRGSLVWPATAVRSDSARGIGWCLLTDWRSEVGVA